MKLYYEENELISKPQFDNHMELYNGYINKVNTIDKLKKHSKITDLSATHEDLQYALNGVILHELYFENVKSNNSLASKPIEQIGNFEIWKQEFMDLAKQSRGWVIFIYEPRTQQFLNITLETHSNGLVCCGIPIIVLDMYEHAYYTDYANDKIKYITGFINNIDWQAVKNRVE